MGSLARWTVSGWAYQWLGDRFAYGTLVVNVLGSVTLGLLMEATLIGDVVPREWRAPLTVGFLGAFTTYSTFAYESMRYFEEGAWTQAILNLGANLVLGLGGVWLGFTLARAAWGGT